jgi:TAG lipase/lysophosphatidylethanolamine acyltransferase
MSQQPFSSVFGRFFLLLSAFFFLIYEIGRHWAKVGKRLITGHSSKDTLRDRLQTARSYDEWVAAATLLDGLEGHDQWKADPVSSLYDYKLIFRRLKQLRHLTHKGDLESMMHFLRSGLIRNLGGFSDHRLFEHSHVGTKKIIEEYTAKVVDMLDGIADSGYSQVEMDQVCTFFRNTRQSFGSSALILQGGATFGLYHLGVVKTLNEHDLLPRIICGSGIGALIASLVCIHTDQELPSALSSEGIDLSEFVQVGSRGSIKRKMKRFFDKGYLMDVSVLERCVRANVGDITFEEAYARTKRVLNITVSSTRKFEVPQLLNYLTAPNVLIWSAACASASATGLYESPELLAKDSHGNVVSWNQSPVKWSDYAKEPESPFIRLSELFNVNHFIVSQANPLVAPFVHTSVQPEQQRFIHKFYKLIAYEVKHRMKQMDAVGLLPSFLQAMLTEKYSGNITIAPQLTLKDFNQLMSNPTHASLEYWIRKGEQSTWPLISLLHNRCAIELALDAGYLHAHTTNQVIQTKEVLLDQQKRAWKKAQLLL